MVPVASRGLARRSRITTTMVVDEEKKSTKIPQGFTEYSELLNGRAAMIAILASWGAEILNPAHPTVVQQLQSIVQPILNLL